MQSRCWTDERWSGSNYGSGVVIVYIVMVGAFINPLDLVSGVKQLQKSRRSLSPGMSRPEVPLGVWKHLCSCRRAAFAHSRLNSLGPRGLTGRCEGLCEGRARRRSDTREPAPTFVTAVILSFVTALTVTQENRGGHFWELSGVRSVCQRALIPSAS